MNTARLKPKEDRRLLRGHLWAFRNEFSAIPDLADGALVDVVSADGRPVGRGFYQAQGGIAVRLLTRRRETIDAAFFSARLARAREFRETLYPGQCVYRWVYGESDGLPGLVADRYGEVVVVQTTCAFYRPWCEALAQAFCEQGGVRGVLFQFQDGEEAQGDVPDAAVVAYEGVEVEVRLRAGQKTGLFLDQRDNARAVRAFAKGARVLDGHCYQGVWSCHAALAGAAEVLGVDSSSQAVTQASANARRNGVDHVCTFEAADIAEVLARGKRYDLVILDPPAFAKGRTHAARAMKLYQAINKAAIEAVEEGGFLVTSSCSHFVSREEFLELIKRAVTSAQRHAWALDVRGAAADHPVLIGMPETAYLKCVTLRIF